MGLFEPATWKVLSSILLVKGVFSPLFTSRPEERWLKSIGDRTAAAETNEQTTSRLFLSAKLKMTFTYFVCQQRECPFSNEVHCFEES